MLLSLIESYYPSADLLKCFMYSYLVVADTWARFTTQTFYRHILQGQKLCEAYAENT